MSRVPRLLPLVAVAIGGVLAVKALADVQALPGVFAGATAHAEIPAPTPHAASPLPPSMTKAGGSVLARPAAPACAISPADLAKEAGLSPGELQALQNLGARRGQLDDRERALDTQLQLLAAAEAKVDAKLKSLNDVKAQIQALLGQADQQQQAEVDRLVNVYQKMKPRDAAAVMATLDDKVRVPVAAKMKDAALAAILQNMAPADAKKLTELLAHRYSPQVVGEADPANPPAAPPPTAAPPPPAVATAAGPANAPVASRRPHRHVPATDRGDTPTLGSAKALGAAPPPASPTVQRAAGPVAKPASPATPPVQKTTG